MKEVPLAETETERVFARLDGEGVNFVYSFLGKEHPLPFFGSRLRGHFVLVSSVPGPETCLNPMATLALEHVVRGFREGNEEELVIGITTHYCGQVGAGAFLLPNFYERTKRHTTLGALYLFFSTQTASRFAKDERGLCF